jgi:hypothetical protein
MPEHETGPSGPFMALLAGAMALTAVGTTTATMADAWFWELFGILLSVLALVLIGVALLRERRRGDTADGR